VAARAAGFQGLAGLDEARARRVEVRVVAQRLELPAAAAVHDEGLIPPAEPVAQLPVRAAEAVGAGAQEPLPARRQIALGHLEHKMEVIGPEAAGVELPARHLSGLAQGRQKPPTILVVPENGLPAVARLMTW